MKHIKTFEHIEDDENENGAWIVRGDLNTVLKILKQFLLPHQYTNFYKQTLNSKPIIGTFITRYKPTFNESGFTYWLFHSLESQKEAEQFYSKDKENSFIAGELYLKNRKLVKDPLLADMNKYNL